MIGRRDIIKFTAGSAVGTALTPIPWKLLDDTAIWSQNWGWIPKVPQGEITAKASTCTLCPAGCALNAECVAGRAVGVKPSGPALCPAGFGAHTAPYHPRRVTSRRPVPERVTAALKKGPVAILDLGPRGRAVASLYAQSGAALYRLPDTDEAFLNVLAAKLGREPGSLGLDLEHTRTLISFGAPVLEDWVAPARVAPRWRSGDLKIIQIEPRQSRTALAADRWIPALSTTEDFESAEKPAVAVGNIDPEALADLNLKLGAVGREGGIIARNDLPFAVEKYGDWTSVPDHSLTTLIVDSSRASGVTPWPMIARKLAGNAVVVMFAYKQDALTAHADWVLPVSAPLETLEDVATPPLAAVASYSIAPPLAPAAVKETPIDHLNAILGTTLPSVEDTIKQRLDATKQGETLAWMDASPAKQIRAALKPAGGGPTVQPSLPPLALLITASRTADKTPFETKLDQESGLYPPATLARMNPETASALKLESNCRIEIGTRYGSVKRQVLLDPAVMPRVVEVAATPAVADVADIATDGAPGEWNIIAANVRRS